jgi:hypothetical protein
VAVRVSVAYFGGTEVSFADVIQTTAMSAAGDTGAILMDEERRAVGMLFAGSSSITLFLPIRRVLDALGVTLVNVAGQPRP